MKMEKLDIMTKLVNERNIDQVCACGTVVQAGLYLPRVPDFVPSHARA